MSHKSVPQECPTECPTRVSYKSVSQECPTRVSHKSVPQECPTGVSYKSVPQEFPTRVAHKSVLQSVPQECPTRVSFGHISFSIVFAFGFVGSILFFFFFARPCFCLMLVAVCFVVYAAHCDFLKCGSCLFFPSYPGDCLRRLGARSCVKTSKASRLRFV